MADKTEKELQIATLRSKALQDTEKFASSQRFALFSQPPPLAIGDDSLDHKKLPSRDPTTNKPITQPRNIQVSAPQGGKIKDSFFSVLGFTTIGDKYVDPERQKRLYELEKKALQKNEQEFKPASGYKTIIKGAYEYKEQGVQKPKVHRDADGKVITAPSNINTNPVAKPLYKFPEHKPDQYERMRELQKQERQQHKAKLGERGEFKTTEHGNKTFVDDKKTFGLDGELPPAKPPKTVQLNIMKHEAPFKPSNPPKQGLKGYLNPFPEYKPNPAREVKRRNFEKGEAVFKPNNGGNLTRPTPTISCNVINIRREIGHSARM